MDELNEIIAAMPDGSTLTLEPGARYELSTALKIVGKRRFTLQAGGAVIAMPRPGSIDFQGSRDCGVIEPWFVPLDSAVVCFQPRCG